jgi:hypothetical protein
MSQYNPERNAAYYNEFGTEYLPGLMGVNVLEVGQGFLRAELQVRKVLIAPNGFLHAGTVWSPWPTRLAAMAAPHTCLRAPKASPP